MSDSKEDVLSWDNLTWQDIQAIGMALSERHPDLRILTMPADELANLVCALPGFTGDIDAAPDYLLSAIASAWIYAAEGEDDSSPYEFLA